MAVAGVSMVRDEADVIEGVVRHMAAECDWLLVADNRSTDGTREILAGLAGELPLTVVDDPEPGYYQSAKMTALAARAAEQGAEWIVPFDADELWHAPGGRLRAVLPALGAGVAAAVAELTNHYPTAHDPAGHDPFRTMVWRHRQAGPMGKVAFRWAGGAVIHQGNHSVDLPAGGQAARGEVFVRHFPYRSAEQFTRKARNGAAAYAAAPDLRPDYGTHWRQYGEILAAQGEAALQDVFRRHFWYPRTDELVFDPAPYRRWERG